MRKLGLALICTAFFCAPLGAETLAVHKARLKAEAVGYPSRGEPSKAVLKKWGEPKLKHAPVGGDTRKQPAITRWDYETFSVFFESGRVIDAVVYDQPPPVSHIEQLKPAN